MERAGVPAIARTPAPKRQTTGLGYIAVPRQADPPRFSLGSTYPAGLALTAPGHLAHGPWGPRPTLGRLRTSENAPSTQSVNKGKKKRKGRGGCAGPLTDGRGAPFSQPLSCDPSARVASRASCCAPRNRAPAAAPLPRDR